MTIRAPRSRSPARRRRPLSNVNDGVAGQPVITGTPEEDQTLIADTSGISDADGLGAFSYQWYRDGSAIGRRDGKFALTLGDADVGTQHYTLR